MIEEVRVRPIVAPAVLLGIGLGGFVDAIVLRQILQWHELLSSVRPAVDLASMKFNLLWDGFFLAAMFAFTLSGVLLLFSAGRRDDVVWSPRIFFGAMLFGWGLYNFIEGIVAHLVAGIHHVHPGVHQLAWDIAFVTLGGAGLMLVGYFIGRTEISGDRMSPATRRALAM